MMKMRMRKHIALFACFLCLLGLTGLAVAADRPQDIIQKISKDIEKEEESKLVMRDMFTLLGKYRKVKELRK